MRDVEILASVRGGHGSVSATRTGDRQFTGRSARGGEVRIGPEEVPGTFTPGELLKVALAACAGMSADRVLQRRLGRDVAATYWVHGTSDEDGNRYTRLDEEFVIAGFDALDADERDRLITLMARAIERSCTVGRTLEGAVDISTTVADATG